VTLGDGRNAVLFFSSQDQVYRLASGIQNRGEIGDAITTRLLTSVTRP
jgi:hypothetical protein